MADNDRFEIVKLLKRDCDKCKQINALMPVSTKDCPTDCSNKSGKTRAEYEQELAELIYKDVEQIVLETINETTKWKPSEYFKKAKSISKKTVDRLFGEGK